MAIALVGSAGTIASGTATTLTPAFAQATTAGDFLVCRAATQGTTTFSISGTGWLAASAGNNQTKIFFKPNCGASESAPSLTGLSSGVITWADLTEWSAVATTSPLDKVNAAVATNLVAQAFKDTMQTDLCVAVLTGTTSKTTTVTFSDAWSVSGGTVYAAHGTGGTSATAFAWFSAYVLTAGAFTPDQDSITATPAKGTWTPQTGQIASFLPFVAPAFAPLPSVRSFVPQMRASTWFSRVPWHEKKPGGFLLPSDAERRLVVAGA